MDDDAFGACEPASETKCETGQKERMSQLSAYLKKVGTGIENGQKKTHLVKK